MRINQKSESERHIYTMMLNKENPFNFAVLNEELFKEVPDEIKNHLHYIFIHNVEDDTFEIRKDLSGTLAHRSPLKNEDELYDLIYEIYNSFDKVELPVKK